MKCEKSVWFAVLLKRVAIALCVLICLRLSAQAQDAFHIQVHTYEPSALYEWSAEIHANYVGIGSQTSIGETAPTHNQFHLSYEIAAGMTPYFSIGTMVLTGRRTGGDFEYAGAKILPHFFVPKTWKLPVDVGLVAEFSFLKRLYDENHATLVIHPVFEKRFGKVVLTLNAGFERSLRGPDVVDGWTLNTALSVRYDVSSRFTPTIEYYRESDQFNHFVMKCDIQIAPRFSWRPGIGVGPTPSGSRLIFSSAFEFEFGR